MVALWLEAQVVSAQVSLLSLPHRAQDEALPRKGY